MAEKAANALSLSDTELLWKDINIALHPSSLELQWEKKGTVTTCRLVWARKFNTVKVGCKGVRSEKIPNTNACYSFISLNESCSVCAVTEDHIGKQIGKHVLPELQQDFTACIYWQSAIQLRKHKVCLLGWMQCFHYEELHLQWTQRGCCHWRMGNGAVLVPDPALSLWCC